MELILLLVMSSTLESCDSLNDSLLAWAVLGGCAFRGSSCFKPCGWSGSGDLIVLTKHRMLYKQSTLPCTRGNHCFMYPPPPQVEDRLAIVDRFNDPGQGVFVFLLSTRAGGQVRGVAAAAAADLNVASHAWLASCRVGSPPVRCIHRMLYKL